MNKTEEYRNLFKEYKELEQKLWDREDAMNTFMLDWVKNLTRGDILMSIERRLPYVKGSFYEVVGQQEVSNSNNILTVREIGEKRVPDGAYDKCVPDPKTVLSEDLAVGVYVPLGDELLNVRLAVCKRTCGYVEAIPCGPDDGYTDYSFFGIIKNKK